MTGRIRQDDYAGALAILDRQPEEEQGLLPLYYRGYCLSKLGRRAEALAALERAYAQDHQQAAVLRLLGRIYYSIGQTKEAERYLREALAVDPAHEKTAALVQHLQTANGGRFSDPVR